MNSGQVPSVETSAQLEKEYVAIFLLEPERFKERTLPTSDLGIKRLRDVLEAMESLDAEGKDWNETTLAERLEERGKQASDWHSYLTDLYLGLPKKQKIPVYEEAIRKEAIRRRLDRLQERLKKRVQSRTVNPFDTQAWLYAQLEQMAESATSSPATQIWQPETMKEFLNADESEDAYLIANVLRKGEITEQFSPRGLGKTVLTVHYAVTLVRQEKRVFYMNRDNPRRYIRDLLLGFGVTDDEPNLHYIGRDRCPKLTEPENWPAFPYEQYDVVIIDSFDSHAEGVGEQDSSKPSRALAPLLDLCRKKNGPAVLVLGNTVRTGAHSRGSGVIEDRADIIYEVRDATGFQPSGTRDWVEELPAQGAADWQARSSRRKGRTIFRLATICTKIRGEEPVPRVLEVNLEHEPHTVTDVTEQIDRAGEAARLAAVKQKANRHGEGVEKLRHEIKRRDKAGEPAILKREAEKFLMASGLKRAEACAVIAEPLFIKVHGTGKGHPIELRLGEKNETPGEIDSLANHSNDAGFKHTDYARPDGQHTGTINPSEIRMDKGDLQSAISPENPNLLPGRNWKN